MNTGATLGRLDSAVRQRRRASVPRVQPDDEQTGVKLVNRHLAAMLAHEIGWHGEGTLVDGLVRGFRSPNPHWK